MVTKKQKINQMSKQKGTIPSALRGGVWTKYNGKIFEAPCYVCQNMIDVQNYEAGHVISENNGGKTELKNLRPICRPCNNSMHSKNMDEYVKEYGYESKILNEEIPNYKDIKLMEQFNKLCEHKGNHENKKQIEMIDNIELIRNKLYEDIKLIRNYTFTCPTKIKYGLTEKIAEGLEYGCESLNDHIDELIEGLPKEIEIYLKNIETEKQNIWKGKLIQCFINIVRKLSQGIHIKYYYQHFMEGKDQKKEYYRMISTCAGEEYVMKDICRRGIGYIEGDELFGINKIGSNGKIQILGYEGYDFDIFDSFWEGIYDVDDNRTKKISPCDWFIIFDEKSRNIMFENR